MLLRPGMPRNQRHDHFPVILQERQPPLAWVTAATNSPKVPGHASFRDDKAELLQFTVDFWAFGQKTCRTSSIVFEVEIIGPPLSNSTIAGVRNGRPEYKLAHDA